MTTAHVLLTRFNLPSEGAESLVRAREGWLRDRIELFERYTVPSVRAQTLPVGWLVYADTESPGWLLERLRRHEEAGVLTVLLRQVVRKDELLRDLHRVVTAEATRLVTTNLDNDDGLAADFSERVRSAAAAPGPAAIYLEDGLVATAEAAYLRTDPTNAFCSAVTDVPATLTCWEDWHNRLHLHMPVRSVPGPPAWLQVVHDGNVSNRVRGRLISPMPLRDRFPGLLEGIPEPTRAQVLRDRLLSGPVRATRGALRTRLRQVLVERLGKERFTSMKESWARLKSPGTRS